ncbi:MAG: FG-GAP-like repeat-containing protein, partial [Actinomycetia bacterium]|nr:FG-GAP-like repeat-containing protein [Actinomycetes bacterium]
MAKALGVAPVDLDGDGRLDLLVANDTVQNFLLRNRGDGTFEEIGTAAGVAFDRDGAATGAMGIDTARYRNDEALAVAIGNFANEMTSFYVTQGVPDLLADEAIQAGIGPASRQALTFGLFFFDADLDGQIDLLQANGHLEAEINQVQPSQHYAQPAQLFWNCGPDCPAAYVPVPGQRLGDMARPMVGRGATYADVDGDGDLDVLLTENGGPPRLLRNDQADLDVLLTENGGLPRLLRNDQALGHHWLRVRLLGRAPNPDAVGALVELTAGGVTQYRQVTPARSYLSQVELPVTFGLGQSAAVERLRVTWPDGSTEDVPVEGVDRLVTVRQAGAGPAATAVPSGSAPATPPAGSPATALAAETPPAAASVPTPRPPAAATPPPAASAEGDGFVEIAGASGLDFVQFNGMSGEWYLVENLGGGAALLDYDGDGDLDVFLVQGEMLGPKPLSAALFPPQPGKPPGARLYRNDLTVNPDGTRSLRFTDVTGQSGIRDTGYGMGVAAADYDNDGHVDLYLTNLGPNQLWRNRGDGTFVNVTAEAGTGDPRLSVSAAFLDYDRDGRLDLFVGNYVDFSPDNNRPCYAPWSARDYCSPKVYRALPDTLYRNRGDGTFEDVGVKSRVAQEAGTALGVVATDFNGDGWADLYVANDGMANHLWMNQRDGSFVNDALIAGAAVNREGMAEASMGVDAGDVDGDGDEDLFMTHLAGETNTLYINNGEGWFEDHSVQSGVAGPSKAYTSFGTAFFDYDNDGDLDLFVASGAVNIIHAQVEAGDPYPLRQPKQLYENLGDGRFREVTAQAGAALQVPEVSRGVAFGDLDNDGDTDLVVVNNNGPVRLLENRIGTRNRWIGLRLLGREGRDAVGARVALERAGRPTLWRRVRADGSYACANDPRVLVGLGPAGDVREVRIHWP